MPNIAKALEKAGKSPAYAKIVEYLIKDHEWHVSREIEHECYLPQPQVSLVLRDLVGYIERRLAPSRLIKGRPMFEYHMSEEMQEKLFADLRAGIEKEFKGKIEALEGV